jgi:hypothetical protein
MMIGRAPTITLGPVYERKALPSPADDGCLLLVLGLRLREVRATVLIDRCREKPGAIPGQSLPKIRQREIRACS